MRVKVSNPRSGSVDYVSQALRLSVPAYAKEMLVDLPPATANRWVDQLKKDGLEVKEVTATPAPKPTTVTTSPSKTEPVKEETKSTSSRDSKTSTSKK